MFKPGSRLPVALFTAATLSCLDARMALAQTQQPQAAQEGIQEIIVTAQRRTENLQNVPIAITAISAESLNKAGVTDFSGVAQQSTSINFTPYPSSSNTLILYMRGQGVADANQITQDGSVGLYEDGFYIARPQAETFDLADVERVEVLRGPQGTLYGRNTTGGAVNIISKKPTGDLDFKVSLDGGNRSYVRALGTINLPTVLGGLSSKLTLLYSNLDGNVSNTGRGSDYQDYNREVQKGARASLRWDTGGPFSADYFYEVGELESTPIYYQDAALAGNPLIPGYPATVGLASSTWRPTYLPLSVAKFNSDGLTLNFRFSDAATLRSLTYYRGLDSRFYQDYAGAFSDPLGALQTGVTNFTSDDVVQSNEFTQELQLVGTIAKKVDYVAGLYYFDEHANHNEVGTIGIPLQPIPGVPIYTDLQKRYVTADAKSKAAYAQFTWHITDPFSITLGARYTKDDRSATRVYTDDALAFVPPPANPFCPPFCQFPINHAGNSANQLSFHKFNPAGTLNMAWTPDINTYLRIASGYKAGGSTEAAPLVPTDDFPHTFKPENVTTYELGLKSYWFEHRLRANIAAFYSKFSDMQLQFNVNPANLAIVQSYNAGSAKVKGAEFEFLFAPIPDLTVGLNDTVLSSEMDTVYALPNTVFDPAVNPYSPYHTGQNIANLFRVPYAPNNILNANLDWTVFHASGGNLELFANYRLQGREYNTATTGVGAPGATQFYSIPSYGVLDGKLTWNFNSPDSKHTMRLSLWCKNCADRQYQQHVIGQGAAPYIPVANFGVTGYTYNATAWAPKISYGAQFQYGF